MELRVRGELAGDAVSEQAEVAGHNLDNGCTSTDCYVDVYFVGGGRLHLEWPAPLTLDQEATGSGYLNLFARDGPNVGNSGSDGLPSRVTLGPNEVGFVLRQLREAPYSTGSAVAGELSGCATFSFVGDGQGQTTGSQPPEEPGYPIIEVEWVCYTAAPPP